jgi:hypothetical protein
MKRRANQLISLLALAAACSSDEPIMQGVVIPPPGAAGTGALPPTTPAAMNPMQPPATGAAGTGTNVGPMNPMQVPPATGAAGTAANPGPGTMMPPPEGGMPMDCRGFSFENIKYSPGGSVLPNKCEPYHPTNNNPYAVRCTDVWPWYKTKFPGDNFCILPPAPDKGVQYGVHPQGLKWFEQVSSGDMSGYDVTDTVWLMEDGQEESANYLTSATNPSMQNFYRNYPRMRPGSHHMIVSVGTTGMPEKWGPDGGTGLGAEFSLPGAQRPDENAPKSLEKPAEDKGLFSRLPANPSIIFNMHHFNASGKQILKEAWTNLWWETDATIQVYGILGLEFTQVATLAIPAGGIVDLHYSWNITQPIRLVTAFGHRHAWTTNFSAWVQNPDGKNDIVYQSYQWLDEPTYRYDSQTMNPTPNPTARTDGASSGIRTLMPGQKLHFNCHIEFTDARAQTEKAPMPADVGILRFANEAFTAEMCILFGSTAAVRMPTPVVDTSPLPDFAQK